MRDHGAESFIKINPNVAASGSLAHVRFQRANRKAGRPQSGVKCATLRASGQLIYRLFVVIPTILNL